MSDGEDLIGKADALLSRYRAGPTPDFPVLTEVVELPAESQAGLIKADAGLPSTAAPPSLEEELRDLQYRLESQILESIKPYMSSLLAEPLEERVRAQLETALSRVAADITTAIRADTAELVQKAISIAVDNELNKLRVRLGSR